MRPLSGRPLLIAALSIGIATFAFRLVLMSYSADGMWRGLIAVGNYDDGVYFSSAVALINGRLPYRDFLLIQPPGLPVILAPFALLTHVVGDAAAFVIARVAFIALGGLNAALVVLLLRRYGARAAVTAGILWIIFLPAVYSERSTLLEGIGNTTILLALLLTTGRASSSRNRTRQVLAGVALGVGVAVKIWLIVPAIVILIYRRHAVWRILAGGAAAAIAIMLPFFLAAPTTMWQQVVLDQLGRPRIAGSVINRLWQIVRPPNVLHIPRLLTVSLILVVVIAICIIGWRTIPELHLYTALFVSTAAVLLLAPSFFRHYTALTAVPFIAIVGIGVGILDRRLVARPRRDTRLSRAVLWAPTAIVVVVCLAAWPGTATKLGSKQLPAGLTAAVASIDGCVTTDMPSTLILTNKLSEVLARGCEFWPDVSGWQYDISIADGATSTKATKKNSAVQQKFLSYLTSGDAVLLARHNSPFSRHTQKTLTRGELVFQGEMSRKIQPAAVYLLNK